MGLEYERKYSADLNTLQKIHASLSEPPYVLQMESTYYDTPDSALSRQKITLRRRYENGTSICTLKTPADGIGRGEFQTEANSIAEAIPVLCKLSNSPDLGNLAKAGLTEVCGARFIRIARKINFRGSLLELALDQGVLLGGGKELPLYEVEVELLSGDPKDADLYGAFLAAKFSLQEEEKSKFRRAMALAKGEI